jgi:tetratricopeptide (TPR) repeat protein
LYVTYKQEAAVSLLNGAVHDPMSTPRSLILTLTAAILLLPPAISAQTGSRKPALIRDTDTAEGKETIEPVKPKEYNPMEAEKNLQIGNFYFKGRNYDAAIMRYLEALEYQPDFVKAFDALARAYEKSKQYDKAAAVCRDFLRKHPGSSKAADFKSMLGRLEKK